MFSHVREIILHVCAPGAPQLILLTTTCSLYVLPEMHMPPCSLYNVELRCKNSDNKGSASGQEFGPVIAKTSSSLSSSRWDQAVSVKNQVSHLCASVVTILSICCFMAHN